MELKFDPGFRVIEEYLSKIDSILRVNFNLTLNISNQFDSNILQLALNLESIGLKYSPITRDPGSNFSTYLQWLNFLGQNDYFFSFSADVQTWDIYSEGSGSIILKVSGMDNWSLLHPHTKIVSVKSHNPLQWVLFLVLASNAQFPGSRDHK